jgi:hypothetical protein
MYSMVAPLPELEARLFFDAPERTLGDIPLRGHNRNPAGLDGMLELFVAPSLRDLAPSVLLEPADDFTAVHRGASSLLENTHFVYTHQ